MFEALVITLREGVEAVLVLAIALATLRRRGQAHLSGALYAGTGAALILSMGVAALATRVSWNEELAEGIAMLVGAVLVVTLVIWMWRAAPSMKEEIESGVGRAAERKSGVAGIFLFAFAMVFREGVETAIFLSAARFNSEGLALWMGAVAGLALAFGFGVLFVRGSVRVPLRAFFTLTSAVLAILALQLVAGGLHELSEALVLPASKTEMAIIGPIVRSDLLLFTLTIALISGWLLFGPGRPAAAAASPAGATGAEARLIRAEASRDAARRRWIGIVGVLMVGLLTTAFVRQSRQPLRAPAEPLALAEGEARFDPAALADGHLRFYEVPVDGRTVRFFALKVGEEVRTCVDACEICGDKGYYERGPELICRNCVAPIVRTSLGRSGGCNPIPLPNRRTPDGAVSVSGNDLKAVIPHLGGR